MIKATNEKENASIQGKYTIYVLKLTKGKYYVGKAGPGRLDGRIKEHRDGVGKGSAWTSLFKVERQMKELFQYNKDSFDEDRKVKQLMYKFGIQNVRGGSYSQTVALTPNETAFILRQFNGATDKCFRCHKHGHFIRQCRQPYQKIKNNLKDPKEQKTDKKQDKNKNKKYSYIPQCGDCHGYGHYQCNFKQFEQQLKNKYKLNRRCSNCGKKGHFQNECTQQNLEEYYDYQQYEDYDGWINDQDKSQYSDESSNEDQEPQFLDQDSDDDHSQQSDNSDSPSPHIDSHHSDNSFHDQNRQSFRSQPSQHYQPQNSYSGGSYDGGSDDCDQLNIKQKIQQIDQRNIGIAESNDFLSQKDIRAFKNLIENKDLSKKIMNKLLKTKNCYIIHNLVKRQNLTKKNIGISEINRKISRKSLSSISNISRSRSRSKSMSRSRQKRNLKAI